jgi:uncharacterized membrane protein YfcA
MLFMQFSFEITLLILCPLIFLASFIDSIAGGGGLISLPAYLFVGIPIHTAAGTKKLVSSTGTATAVVNYIRSGCVDAHSAIAGAPAAIAGSWIGTMLALSLSSRTLQICRMVILPLVGIFILTRGGIAEESLPKKCLSLRIKLFLSFLIGLIIGTYDGFFGPGTGMFMTLALSSLVKLELIKAVGTTKVLNFSSNIASMLTWLASGNILFSIAIPCIICSMSGGFLGSRMAIKIGRKFIRLILALVAVLLFIKILSDLIMGQTWGQT